MRALSCGKMDSRYFSFKGKIMGAGKSAGMAQMAELYHKKFKNREDEGILNCTLGGWGRGVRVSSPPFAEAPASYNYTFLLSSGMRS